MRLSRYRSGSWASALPAGCILLFFFFPPDFQLHADHLRRESNVREQRDGRKEDAREDRPRIPTFRALRPRVPDRRRPRPRRRTRVGTGRWWSICGPRRKSLRATILQSRWSPSRSANPPIGRYRYGMNGWYIFPPLLISRKRSTTP